MAHTTNQMNANASDEISLKDLLLNLRGWRKYIIAKWKIILIACLIGAVFGLTLSFLIRPIYKAELSFALQDDNSSSASGLGAAVGLASQFGIDLGASAGGAFTGDNLIELLKSRAMIENTLLTPIDLDGEKQTLAHLYMTFNKFQDDWKNDAVLSKVDFLPGVDRSKFTLHQDSVLGVFYRKILKKNLTVDKTDKKLSIIDVEVDSKDELFSKYFAEVLVKKVSDFYIDTKTKRSSQNVMVLQRLTDSVRRELNSAITGVASTSDVNPNPNPTLQILRVPSQHRQVDVEANGAMLTELVKNLELAKISLRKETPLIQVIDTPILPLEQEKIGKLKGIVIGGLLGGILTIITLSLIRYYRTIMYSGNDQM
jgi:hypothetical protein